jgi:hypothetical protein
LVRIGAVVVAVTNVIAPVAGEVEAHQAAEDHAERHRGDGVEDLLGESNGPPPYTQTPWRTGTLQLNGEPAGGGSAFRKKKQLFNNNDHIRLFGNMGGRAGPSRPAEAGAASAAPEARSS